MTCIAWDGSTLAADRRVTYGGTIAEITKIFKIDGLLVGGAGEFPFVLAMIEWVRGGRITEQFPESQRHKDDWQPLIVIELNGALSLYERTPFPVRYESKCMAIGSGRKYAKAALHLGKTASEAVEVACALDIGCGNGIDTLTLG